MNKKPSWKKTAFDLIAVISQRSDDPDTQVGAVIFDRENRIVSMGYNGFPRGVNHINYRTSRENGEKYRWMVHAEQNALNFADRSRLKGSTIYVSFMPCARCAQDIIQTGIGRVIVDKHRQKAYEQNASSKYLKDKNAVMLMFSEAGIKYFEWSYVNEF